MTFYTIYLPIHRIPKGYRFSAYNAEQSFVVEKSFLIKMSATHFHLKKLHNEYVRGKRFCVSMAASTKQNTQKNYIEWSSVWKTMRYELKEK